MTLELTKKISEGTELELKEDGMLDQSATWPVNHWKDFLVMQFEQRRDVHLDSLLISVVY